MKSYTVIMWKHSAHASICTTIDEALSAADAYRAAVEMEDSAGAEIACDLFDDYACISVFEGVQRDLVHEVFNEGGATI